MNKTTIYFVYRPKSDWEAYAELDCPPLPDEIEPLLRLNEGSVCWIVQKYLHPRRRGMDVRLVSDIQPNAINIVHYDNLDWKRFPFLGFVVAVQADCGRPEISEVRVVQNRLCIRNSITDYYLPLWTQAGFKPRDESRGNRLERLSYYGLDIYLAQPFQSDVFKLALADLGVIFETRTAPNQWADYTQTDAILAVRQVSDYYLSLKPPTKLLNAWKAGCIPILGFEPAYRQIATPDEEYFEVSHPEQVIDLVKQLKADPRRLEEKRFRGRNRIEEFTDDRLAEKWIALLNGSIYEQYKRWQNRGLPFCTILRFIEFGRRFRSHFKERALWYNSVVK